MSQPSGDQQTDEQLAEARKLLAGSLFLPWLTAGGRGETQPSQTSPLVILVVNLIPAAGVLMLGWEAFTVVMLYWLENAVVGLVTVLKILTASGGMPQQVGAAGKLFMIPFFCVHYGIFMLVHGVFIVVLLGGGMRPGVDPFAILGNLGAMGIGFFVAAIGFLGEHLYAFYRDYWRTEAYRKMSPAVAMFSPYGRIVVLHLAILGGGFLMVMLGLPRLMVLLLVVFKIAYELTVRGAKGLVKSQG